MARGWRWLAAPVALALVAAFAAPLLFDWRRLTPHFERGAVGAMGGAARGAAGAIGDGVRSLFGR